MKKISRAIAKLKNLKYYFTGIPCKHGHVAQRRVVNGECLECGKEERKINQAKRTERFIQTHGRDYVRQKSKQHYNDHKQDYINRTKEWYKKNKDIVKHRQEEWRSQNKEYMQQYLKLWWSKNPHRSKEYQKQMYTVVARKKWNARNKGLKRYYTQMRRKAIKQATPKWACMREIKSIYILAEEMSRVSNQQYHVDHIVPIKGKNVCGLHVSNNLQIITKQENLRKGNKYLL